MHRHTTTHRRRHALGVVLAALAAVVAGAWAGGAVSAHAELVQITPADGAVLASAPTQVELRFSEPVSLTGGAARVLDDGAVTVSADARVDGAVITIPLTATLADGTYTVAWDVISQDSHPIGGASVFHVGAPSADGAVDVGGGGGAGWGVRAGAAVLASLAYAGALVGVGAWWFVVAGGADTGPTRRRIGSLVERAAVLGSVSLVASAPVRIARLGGGLGALRDNALLAASLSGPIGVSTMVTASALLVLAAIAGRASRGRPLDVLGAAAGLVALAGFAVEGHTRSQRPTAVMATLDVVHLAAGAIWLGGIVALVLALRSAAPVDGLGRLVGRFSAIAVLAVLAVVAAGAGMAWIVLPSVGSVVSTGYGLALLTKVALVVPVVAMGAYNRRRLVPAMSVGAAAPERQRARLRRIVGLELAALLAVVGVTSVLVTRSPVGSSAAPPAAPLVAPEATRVPLSSGAGTALFTLAPARAGQNEIVLVLLDPSGGALVPIEAPTVELTEPALGVGPLRPLVHPLDDGRYHVIADLPLAGTYRLVVRVRVGDFAVTTAETTVTIG